MENLCENNEHNFSVKFFNVPHNKIRGHVRRITNQIAVLWCHLRGFCSGTRIPIRYLTTITPTLTRRLTYFRHTCDISLFLRDLPIFCPFLRKSHYQNLRISFYILYISLFGISGLPTKIWEFPSLFNHSPYLKKKISIFVISNVSRMTIDGNFTSKTGQAFLLKGNFIHFYCISNRYSC